MLPVPRQLWPGAVRPASSPTRPRDFAILPESIGIIGLGAIGGSLAWRATQAGVPRVIGYCRATGDVIEALKRGAITDAADTPQAAVHDAAFVVLAIPPGSDTRPAGQGRRVAPAGCHPLRCRQHQGAGHGARARGRTRGRFAGAHPLAGTHATGFGAARPDLFRGAVVYVCSTGTLEGDQVARGGREFLGAGRARRSPSPSTPRRTTPSSPGPATCRRRSRPRWRLPLSGVASAAYRSGPVAATRPDSPRATPTCGRRSSSPMRAR